MLLLLLLGSLVVVVVVVVVVGGGGGGGGGVIIQNSPDSVTHPKSLITLGWGFNFFINSSSESKSLRSVSLAFAVIIKYNTIVTGKTKPHNLKKGLTKPSPTILGGYTLCIS